MKLYKKLLRLGLNTDCIGLCKSDPKGGYFCTPKGASVFGREGVDGIHYCFIAGFHDTVFAVSPMNEPGNYVHPIAVSFDDLLRLLLACGSMAAIEQIHGWSKEQFDAYLAEYPPTDEQKEVLNTIAKSFELEPLKHPYEYVKEIQADFDYSKIRFTKEYYEVVNGAEPPKSEEFKVYFNGFGSGGSRERPAAAIPAGNEFVWGDDTWYVPAVYSCSSGIVVDFCIKVPTDKINAYIDKVLSYGDDIPDDVREALEDENPFNHHADYNIVLNSKVLHWSNASSSQWNPCMPDGYTNDNTALQLVEHYELDEDIGWTFIRVSFPTESKRKTPVRSLTLMMKPEPVQIHGDKFTISGDSEEIEFVHPVSSDKHTLKVIAFNDEILNMHDESHDWPSHYIEMKYVITPELPKRSYYLKDTSRGDNPKTRVNASGYLPEESAAIGIIGGADGPTAVFVASGERTAEYRSIASSLHFEPVDSVDWQIVFNVIDKDEIAIKLV